MERSSTGHSWALRDNEFPSRSSCFARRHDLLWRGVPYGGRRPLAVPLTLEVEQRGQLAIVGEGLPAGVADHAQGFGRAVALGDQDRAGHQRTAADAVLTVQKRPAAVGNVVEHPVDALVHLLVRKPVPI